MGRFGGRVESTGRAAAVLSYGQLNSISPFVQVSVPVPQLVVLSRQEPLSMAITDRRSFVASREAVTQATAA
jgi:hypothetical protein